MWNLDIMVKQPPEPELVAKSLKEYHATKVSKARVLERKTQCLQAFSHRER
jgi:hypothetical protein